MIGKTLGKYRVIERIGRGGMAEVYKAYHPGLDRYVAIKLMHSFLADEEGFLERFQREAQSVARLRHPNIVQMYDFDAQDDVYYMVMEYLQGPSLKNKLTELESQGQWLTLEQAVRIVQDVGEALEYAHHRRMIHRDVKPANIMLSASGGAVLTDFGIVKMLTAKTQLTASGAMVGTPAYMAPEQSMGTPGDERADIYSLGIVLYQLVTGRLPFDADTPMAIVLMHLNAPLPMPSAIKADLPQGVERVILKSLARDPQDRYQSVKEMLNQVERAMQGLYIPEVDPAISTASLPQITLPMTTSAEETLLNRIPWWGFALIGIVLVALIVGGALLLSGSDHPSSPTPTVTNQPTPTITSIPSATPTQTPRTSPTPNLINTLQAINLTLNAPTATGIPSPTPTNTAAPSPTPDLTMTARAVCNYDAKLERHITIAPGQYLAPGQSLHKTWRLLNTGDCAWPAGTVFSFVSGNQMGAPDSTTVESIEPGETIDVSIDMRAPNSNGNYSAIWQLQKTDGSYFGEEIPVQINVGPTPTPRATSTPRPTNTPLASPTPQQALHMTVPSLVAGSCWSDPVAGTWGARLGWTAGGGAGGYEYYFAQVAPGQRLEGSIFAFSGQVGKHWGGKFITVSGAEQASHEVWIYPSQCGY